ncbi:MAG: exodeoxyribonuclease III [Candidatus Falkowbacteria bacterium]|nr:exodeoxyribonuclease III [Candidatus Falkowbacteria bacterium]
MKIISWNVNGIRAAAKHGLADFLKSQKPDILCLQEIKISDATRLQTEFDFADYTEHWHSAERPGYSGTAILTREGFKGIKGVKSGFGIEKFDKEGRVQTLESEKFFLLNIYSPNSNHELSRLDYKLEFNDALLKYVKKLERLKPVIITGDFNVAHEAIDLARPEENEGSAGFTLEERAWMTKFLKAGFIDTFRAKNGQKIQYSWWSFRMRARARNIGWRIDYFCVSAKLRGMIKKAYILDKITGSDHAPIGLEL